MILEKKTQEIFRKIVMSIFQLIVEGNLIKFPKGNDQLSNKFLLMVKWLVDLTWYSPSFFLA